MANTHIQLELDVSIKEVDINIRGSITKSKDISVLSLVGALPNAADNLSKILEDYGTVKDIITPFIPDELSFGIYKISEAKESLSAFQLEARYSQAVLKGVFAKEFKLFSVGIAEGINFGNMPLVGEYLKDYTISNIELVYVSQDDKENPLTGQRLKLANSAKKRFVDNKIWLEGEKFNLSNGFNAGLILKLGEEEQKLTYPGFKSNNIKTLGLPSGGSSPKKLDATTPGKAKSNNRQPLVKIIEIKPSIENNVVTIAISADFNIGPFGLQLVGLGIQVPFTVFQNFTIEKLWKEVRFSLDGLALIYDTPALSIAGGFLREVKDGNEEYNGLLTFKLSKIEIIAIGSYIKTPTYSSLFAFGYLGIPIPVDPAFYIHGFALGFGLNRNFVMPDITDIPEFPLLKIVHQGGLKQGDNIKKIFNDLNRYLPASENNYVIVAGIKFDSYKMIFTTGIVAIAFGNRTSFNLLGLSTMQLEGVYNFEFAFAMRADLDEGSFLAQGQLTNNTYALLPQLKLTGGFALGMWLKGDMAGDFVFTLGGYHPNFKVPAHYPKNTPRLGFNFSLGAVQFSGTAYFALTPSCIMAGIGGNLHLVLDGGIVYAEIGVLFSADFIIFWNPFYYKADVYVQIYAKVVVDVWLFSINQSFNLTAKLYIEGPDFRGIAAFEVAGYELEVKFGNDKSIKPRFGIEEFTRAYLPKDVDKSLTANITSGIIRKIKDAKGSESIVVNPKTFTLEIYSEIPITKTNQERLLNETTINKNIHPVYEKSVRLENELKLSLSVNGVINDFSSFTSSPILKSVPKSIWNDTNIISDKDALSNDNLLQNVCKGVRLEFSKVISPISPVVISLYDNCEKECNDDFKNRMVDFKSDTIALNDGIMSRLGILDKDEIDYTDLKNQIDAYKYKALSLGTYAIRDAI